MQVLMNPTIIGRRRLWPRRRHAHRRQLSGSRRRHRPAKARGGGAGWCKYTAHVDRTVGDQYLTFESQAGTGDVLSQTASGTHSVMEGGVNNPLDNGGNAAKGVTDNAGELVN